MKRLHHVLLAAVVAIVVVGCGNSNNSNTRTTRAEQGPCVVRESDGQRLCGDAGRDFCQVADQSDRATLNACAAFDAGAEKNPACAAYEPGDGSYEECMRKNGLR